MGCKPERAGTPEKEAPYIGGVQAAAKPGYGCHLFNSCGTCLNVKITSRCNGRCPFCVGEAGFSAGDAGWKQLAKNTVATGCQSVRILGGEPFLVGWLKDYIFWIRPFVEEILATTNGYALCKRKIRDGLWKAIALVDGLTISAHHYDMGRNNEIYGFASKITERELEAFIKEFHSVSGSRLRISCVAKRGYIDSMGEVRKMVAFCKEIGADELRVMELQHTSPADGFVSFDEIFGEELGRHSTTAPLRDGCDKRTEIGGFPVLTKRTCFASRHKDVTGVTDEDTEQAKKDALSGEFEENVMYSDGTFSRGWLKRSGI